MDQAAEDVSQVAQAVTVGLVIHPAHHHRKALTAAMAPVVRQTTEPVVVEEQAALALAELRLQAAQVVTVFKVRHMQALMELLDPVDRHLQAIFLAVVVAVQTLAAPLGQPVMVAVEAQALRVEIILELLALQIQVVAVVGLQLVPDRVFQEATAAQASSSSK